MTSLLKRDDSDCRSFRTYLEDSGEVSAAKDFSELLPAAPSALRAHAASCAGCREAAEALLASRALLSVLPSSAGVPGPWFAPRVMAAIAARKAELARAADTWTFLPKLASRLTWASSIALLLASAWLYQRPASNPPRAVATDITGDPVAETSAPPVADDVLASLAEKPR